MADAMRLDLEVGGVAAGVTGLRQMASALRAVAKAQEAVKSDSPGLEGLAGRLNDIAGGAQAAAAAPVRRGTRVSGGQTSGGSGPNAALDRAHRQYGQAMLGGQAGAIQDAALNLSRAQARLDRLNAPAPTLAQRLGQAALSTRFNIGGQSGGVSPLVGRTLNALGMSGATAGPVGLALAAITLTAMALKSLAEAAQDGAKALKEISDTASITGGTGAQSGALRGLGISGDFANSLRERLATDPLAMLGAAQSGVGRVTPSVYGGSQNNAAVVLEVLGKLRAEQDPNERIRKARMMGAESLLPLTNASDKATASLLKTAEALGRLSDANKTTSSDWDAATKRMGLVQDRLKGALFQAFGPGMIAVVSKLSSGAEKLADFAEKFPQKLLNSFEVAAIISNPIMAAPIHAAFDALRKQTGVNNPAAAATNGNTKALQNLTYLLSSQIYGGGSRASGALPSGLTGMNLNQAAQNHALRLSYWTL